MAEGWGSYLGDEWEVLSVHIEARGLNQMAVKVINKDGIEILIKH